MSLPPTRSRGEKTPPAMLAIPSAVRLQSSIAAPTAVSKRADTSLGADQALHSHVDPLDGSLGPFLASCVLILIVLLAVASVLYGVHRCTRVSPRSILIRGLREKNYSRVAGITDPKDEED